MNKKYLFFSLLIFFQGIAIVRAQEVNLTLEEAIIMARQASPDYRQAINQAEASYWMYRNYKSRFLPQLSLFSTLPDYSTSLTKVPPPDDTAGFVRQNRSFYSLTLGRRQNDPLTRDLKRAVEGKRV